MEGEWALNSLPSRFHEVREFRRMLDHESHRGCALAAAAFLDERLKQLLRASLVDECVDSLLDGANAPLGSFNARILAVHALALVPSKAVRDLNLIRKIRNEFAHRLDCDSFEVPKVESLCRELYYCFADPKSPRARFTNATTGILALIDFKTELASPPVLPADFTAEGARENFKEAARLELAVRNQEKETVMQTLGICDSTPLLDLLELATRYGLLESQPPRENLLILEILERLITARVKAEAGRADRA